MNLDSIHNIFRTISMVGLCVTYFMLFSRVDDIKEKQDEMSSAASGCHGIVRSDGRSFEKRPPLHSDREYEPADGERLVPVVAYVNDCGCQSTSVGEDSNDRLRPVLVYVRSVDAPYFDSKRHGDGKRGDDLTKVGRGDVHGGHYSKSASSDFRPRRPGCVSDVPQSGGAAVQ